MYKRYDEAFKTQIAKRVADGEGAREIAKEIGVSYYTILDWKKFLPKKHTAKRKTVRKPVGGKPYEALKQENDKLKMELEFFKREWLELYRRQREGGS